MPTIVKPNATRSLCPSAIPGSAGSPAPNAFQPGATRWTVLRKRRQLYRTMRIIGQYRLSGRRHAAVYNPVVAALFRKANGTDRFVVVCQNFRNDVSQDRARAESRAAQPDRGEDTCCSVGNPNRRASCTRATSRVRLRVISRPATRATQSSGTHRPGSYPAIRNSAAACRQENGCTR